jgi:hypothetical protein
MLCVGTGYCLNVAPLKIPSWPLSTSSKVGLITDTYDLPMIYRNWIHRAEIEMYSFVNGAKQEA